MIGDDSSLQNAINETTIIYTNNQVIIDCVIKIIQMLI